MANESIFPDILKWLKPWVPFLPAEVDRQSSFERELKAELGEKHPVFNHSASARAIAYRSDCDDVLFWLPSSAKPFAVVHLIWNGKVEANPAYPTTCFFSSIEEFINENMLPEHEYWSAGN